MIVLLHGTGGTLNTWNAVAPLLEDRFRLLALDLPGHGGTSFPGFEAMTCASMAASVGSAITAVGVLPSAVVGHSAGAAIMLQMAADGLLSREARLVGINAALEPLPEPARLLMQGTVGGLLRSGIARSVVRNVARVGPMIELLLATTGSRLTKAQEEDYVSAFAGGTHAEAAYAMMANWDLLPLRRALASITQQSLFIVGANDPWVPPRVSREAAGAMPNASLRSIAHAGHLVHEECPADVAELIASMLRAAAP